MESSAIARYIPHKSTKRVFSASSSSCAEPEVLEIDPPLADRSAKRKAKGKQKEVAYHEIIDLDMDEDRKDVVLLEGKVESRKRKKGSMGISLGPCNAEIIGSKEVASSKKGKEISGHSYKGFNPGSNNFFDLDDYVLDDDYWTLQSRFDSIGLPAGIEAPVSWLPDLAPMKKQNPAIPFVTSNAHLEASPSQPNRVGPLPSPSLFSSSKNNTTVYGHSSYFDPNHVPAQTVHSNYTQTGSGNYLSNSSNTLAGNGTLSYPQIAMSTTLAQNGILSYPQLPTNLPLAKNGISSYPQLAMNTTYLPGRDPLISSYPQLARKHIELNKAYTSAGMSSRIGGIYSMNDTLSGQDGSVNGPSSRGLTSIESSSSMVRLVDVDVQKRYESFKKFDTVADHLDHYYARQKSEMKQASWYFAIVDIFDVHFFIIYLFHAHACHVFQPPKNWAKKIQEEWRILEKNLPDTIFVRVYESRMDLLRAVIIGAEGTPYHDGLFFFDVCFPSSYPNSPPLVNYHSGGLRINPNLYNCGKVCLSLLNTWAGGHKERWMPSSSTMLQVLVSIQGLILNMKPYFNEPGFAHSSGTVHGEKASLQYNENTLILSLKTMVYTMKKPPKHFEDLVIGHFLHRERDILMACKAYTEGVQVGCLVKGGVQDVDEGSDTCSALFKQNVASYIKTLMAEFKKKSVFSGRSSSCAEPEVTEIDPPLADRKMKSKGKQKEVASHEIIDVDMYEGKVESRKRKKGSGAEKKDATTVNSEVQKRYESFKRFDTVVDHSDHHYPPPKDWAKKIQEEWKILEKNLPDTIFVRVYESRMDLLRAVIIGAEGTPYHDGLFFFDVCLPGDYPNSPPLVHYHSGGLRINPNLYDSGYVCLSLLNTWQWRAEGEVDPRNFDHASSSGGTEYGEKASLQYNENTLILSLKTMVYTMKKPPKHFEDLVIGHFLLRERDILMGCKAYTEGVQVGCLAKGGVQDVDECSNSCSAQFKQNVGSYIKTLIAEFKKLGSKEAHDFLSSSVKERGFSVSSSSYADPEVMEIDPPLVDRSSKRKSKGKQKEVAYHEIIDVDMDEDYNDVVLLEGNFESRKRKKGSTGISLCPSSAEKIDSMEVASNKKGKEISGHSYKGFNPGSNNFFDLDDYVLDDDYLTLQSNVTSNAHLEASLGQPKRVDPSSSTSWFSSNKNNTAVNAPSSKGLSSIESSSSMAKLMDSDVQQRYESFKKFDSVVDHSNHHFANQSSAFTQASLYVFFTNTIFVRVYESRMDLLRAVIIGAEGTPYHDGLFFFDVCFPSSYPSNPPLVHYHSGGLRRINPNLYACGKVCLSLLNTWKGGKKEKWSPRSSTMLQVLVSIQGLILNMKPYFNEPGFEIYSGTPTGRTASLKYNEDILILSLKTMVYTMKNPPKHFEDLVIGHFLLRERDILMACKAYTEGVQVGCLAKGGVQDVDECSNSCSAQFKQNVGSYIKTLIAEFKKKRVFTGSSSSSCAEPEVMEIDPPLADRSSKRKSKGKQKEVAYHEIIDVDMDEDCNDVVLLEGKVKSRKRKKGSKGISLGPSSAEKIDSMEVASNRKGKSNVTSNSHLEPSLSQSKRVDPSSSTSCKWPKLKRRHMFQPPKSWSKKIQEEWRILEKDLPDTIFVRVYESRMDLLRAVIIGAEGTPYHDGLFFFDVCFPSNYPNSPPLVHYHSGGLRINPNLYGCGKVCLSLLNTWQGGKKEMWIPGTSTMLQVLVSIQGLILNMKPYFNEPGYARSSGSVHGEKASLKYNEKTLILSLKTMVYTMKKPPKNFEDLVIGHFQHREHDILMACKAYTEGVQVGRLVKGGVQDVDEGSSSCSAKFKKNVGSYMKTLKKQFKKLRPKESKRAHAK
ncbi:hypothetical protein SSX86_021155 [Deinandra increscens subsp. villosa]|uniref:E2 ubiquitin-conjugating enzyme n=1 Tax=Deinandra increscens subsp. villosa TaxID=3103831 RepID=A0AAP0GSV1_9ASTR